MRIFENLNAYQRTRSGLAVVGLAALAVAAFCLMIVLATDRSYNAGLALLAVATLGLGWTLQNVVRLIAMRVRKQVSAPPLSRRYRYWASVIVTAFILFVPTAQLFLNLQTEYSFRLHSVSGPALCSGINLQPGTITQCLCYGLSLDVNSPGFVPIGFPFATQEDECGSGYGPTGDPDPLASGLDLAAAAIVGLAVAFELTVIVRKVWARVQAR